MKDPRAKALEDIGRDARRMKYASRLPEERRPRGFMISIGLADPDSEEMELGEVEEEAEEIESILKDDEDEDEYED